MAAGPTIHIVDDDASIRRSLQELLHSVGFASAVYETALGFLDVEMPPEPMEGTFMAQIILITAANQQTIIERQQKQIDALTTGLQKVSAAVELNKAAPTQVADNR